jgi:hypothetical protein
VNGPLAKGCQGAASERTGIDILSNPNEASYGVGLKRHQLCAEFIIMDMFKPICANRSLIKYQKEVFYVCSNI